MVSLEILTSDAGVKKIVRLDGQKRNSNISGYGDKFNLL